MSAFSISHEDLRSMDFEDHATFKAAAKWDRAGQVWVIVDRDAIEALRQSLVTMADPLNARKGDGYEARGERLLGATYLRIAGAIADGLASK